MAPRTYQLALAAAAAAGFRAVSAQDDLPDTLPAIDPTFDFTGVIEQGLLGVMPSTEASSSQWTDGYIPQNCKDMIENAGYAATDVEVFEVTYSDCGTPWVMCRHIDSDKSQDEIIDIFGRMPLGMREFVKHAAVVPEVGGGAAAYSTDDSIIFGSDYVMAYIAVHEMSHSLDGHARTDVAPEGMSSSSIWRDAYNADSAVVSEYGRTLWGENFAESGIIGVYDTLVEGGVAAINENWEQVQNQYSTYVEYMGDIIIPGAKGNCTSRLDDSPYVSAAGEAASSRIMGKPKDMSSKRVGIKKISPSVMSSEKFVMPIPIW